MAISSPPSMVPSSPQPRCGPLTSGWGSAGPPSAHHSYRHLTIPIQNEHFPVLPYPSNHPPQPFGTPISHSFSLIRGRLFSAERRSAPSYIIFIIFSKVTYVISRETTSQVYQMASMAIPSRHLEETPYPYPNYGSRGERRFWCAGRNV